jgi:hypothetical protein
MGQARIERPCPAEVPPKRYPLKATILCRATLFKRMEAAMQRHEIVTSALWVALLLTGCGDGTGDIAYSQQRAIRADRESSLQHGPSATDLGMGARFNDDLDAAINDRPYPLGAALGFR